MKLVRVLVDSEGRNKRIEMTEFKSFLFFSLENGLLLVLCNKVAMRNHVGIWCQIMKYAKISRCVAMIIFE